jgi:hypothetical protein
MKRKAFVLLMVVAGRAFVAAPTAQAGVHLLGLPIPFHFTGRAMAATTGPDCIMVPYYGYGAGIIVILALMPLQRLLRSQVLWWQKSR